MAVSCRITYTTVSVAGGRDIAVGQFGDIDGVPVFFFHGALAAWQYRHPDDTVAGRLGVRLITAARPGFGPSTRCRGRTVADWASDVAAIADHLGLDRFAVLGHSGGGPYALACRALLEDRVTAAGAAGSVAPFTSEDRFAALGPAGRVVFETALGELADLEEALGRLSQMFLIDIRQTVIGSFGDEPVSDVPGLLDLLAKDGLDAFAQGASGWADELHAVVRDWAFPLAPATVPTMLWYGEDDLLTATHGDALAARLGVGVTTHAGGHFAFFEQWPAILQTLASLSAV